MSTSPEASLEMSVSATRPRRAPLIAAGVALGLGLAVGAYLLWGRARDDSKALARGMPAGLSGVVGVNFKPLLKSELAKSLLATPIGMMAMAQAKAVGGVDVEALESLAWGVQLVDDAVHMIVVVKGGFETDKLGALIAARGEPVDVDGKAFTRVSPGRPAAPAGEMTSARPAMAELLAGVPDKTTVLAGSPKLLAASLDGGDTVEDDPDLGPRIKDVDDDAIYWGVVRFKADGSDTALLDRVLTSAPAELRPALSRALVGASAMFQFRMTSALEGEVVVHTERESGAQQLAGLLDTAVREPTFAAKIQATGVVVTTALEGSRVSLAVSIPIPELTALLPIKITPPH